jgi:hypothetical protein
MARSIREIGDSRYPAAHDVQLPSRRILVFVAVCLTLTSLSWLATTRVRYATGFTARYYAGRWPAGTAAITTFEDQVATAVVRRTWPRDDAFSVRWDAFLLATHTGPYRLSVLSDGDAHLFVDDRLAFENGGPDGPRQSTAEILLHRGVHTLRLEYIPSGHVNVALLWAPRTLDRLVPLAGNAISPREPSSLQLTVTAVVDVTRAAMVVVWCALFLWLTVAYVVTPAVRALVRHHLVSPVPRSVRALLAAVAAVYLAGITWGLPGVAWAPNELTPSLIFDAVDARFSHGWWGYYSPLQYYLLSFISAPLLVWRWLDPLAFGASLAPDVVLVLFRIVSVAMGVGIVLMVYVCGRYLFPEWPAFVAAASAALTMPALFYAKVANVDVPYVFWFSVSLASFARLGLEESPADYLLLAVTAALAVSTKDQAYGLYVLPGFALLIAAYRRTPEASPIRRLTRIATYRPLWIAATASVVTLIVCNNLILNASGFFAHARFVTVVGAPPFRMFEANLKGEWQLARAVAAVARVSLGWPAFVLCVAGFIVAIVPHARSIDGRSGERRGLLWWIALPAVSYYTTFLAVIGFTYDRFLLPVFVTLAFGAGYCAARLDATRFARSARLAIAGVQAYSCAYGMAVDVALIRNSRYDVEQWVRAHAARDATFGLIGPIEHMPRIDGWLTEFMLTPTVDTIERAGYDYLIVNAHWASRFPPGRAEYAGLRELTAERLKFTRVFEARPASSFAGSPSERLEAIGGAAYSTLSRIDPPIVVYRRRDVSPGTPAPTARTP